MRNNMTLNTPLDNILVNILIIIALFYNVHLRVLTNYCIYNL